MVRRLLARACLTSIKSGKEADRVLELGGLVLAQQCKDLHPDDPDMSKSAKDMIRTSCRGGASSSAAPTSCTSSGRPSSRKSPSSYWSDRRPVAASIFTISARYHSSSSGQRASTASPTRKGLAGIASTDRRANRIGAARPSTYTSFEHVAEHQRRNFFEGTSWRTSLPTAFPALSWVPAFRVVVVVMAAAAAAVAGGVEGHLQSPNTLSRHREKSPPTKRRGEDATVSPF